VCRLKFISTKYAVYVAVMPEPSGESRFKQGETDMGDKGSKDKGKM